MNAQDGINIGEPVDQCCFFIPIKVGIIVIGILVILSAIGGALNTWNGLLWGSTYSIVYGLCYLPNVGAAIHFVKFFQADTPETRSKLP